jgi:hypothetical protein
VTRTAWTALAAALLAAAVALPVGWTATRPAEQVGAPVSGAVGDAAATPAPGATPGAGTAPDPEVEARPGAGAAAAGSGAARALPRTLPRPTARPATPAPPSPRAVPSRLVVNALGVDAPVTSAGVADGAMEIPADGGTVGWYRYGAAPGDAAGSAVLAGHVDTRADGPGALFDLRRLEVGDDVVVVTDRGPLRYRVTGRESVVKTALPVEQLFARDGAHRLVLVTCGGRFVPERRSYEENVVVVAEPLP